MVLSKNQSAWSVFWEFGGGGHVSERRLLWSNYFKHISSMIFFVDLEKKSSSAGQIVQIVKTRQTFQVFDNDIHKCLFGVKTLHALSL